jgi:hypothetical protein
MQRLKRLGAMGGALDRHKGFWFSNLLKTVCFEREIRIARPLAWDQEFGYDLLN